MQVVGTRCRICKARISSVLDAKQCDRCGAPVHLRCAAAFVPLVECDDNQCRECSHISTETVGYEPPVIEKTLLHAADHDGQIASQTQRPRSSIGGTSRSNRGGLAPFFLAMVFVVWPIQMGLMEINEFRHETSQRQRFHNQPSTNGRYVSSGNAEVAIMGKRGRFERRYWDYEYTVGRKTYGGRKTLPEGVFLDLPEDPTVTITYLAGDPAQHTLGTVDNTAHEAFPNHSLLLIGAGLLAGCAILFVRAMIAF